MVTNAYVILKIYDIQGSEITTLVDDELSAGHYKANFDAKNLSSGTYLYKIWMVDFFAVKKMILIK